MVAIRPHAYVGAGLLALAGLSAVASTLGVPRLHTDASLAAYHAGLTLMAQAVAFWYLPSFTKRTLRFESIAAYAGPVLLPIGVAASFLRVGSMVRPLLGLPLILFAIVVLASALTGSSWRGGRAFWAVEGTHRGADRAAAFLFVCSFAWFLVAGLAAIFRPPALGVSWPLALGLFALAALTHLAPRVRGARPIVPLVVAGAVAIQVVIIPTLVALPVRLPSQVVATLFLGPAVVLAALLLPPASKRAGPRWRDARATISASFVAFIVGGVLLVVGQRDPPLAHGGSQFMLAGLGLAIATVTLLAFPVVFNQRPEGRYALPAAIAALAGATAAVLAFRGILTMATAAILLAGALLLWLAALAPLRRPRRACPADGEAS